MRRLGVLLFALLALAPSASAAPTKYSLANGCWNIGPVTQVRLKAAALGKYLVYTKDGQYVEPGGALDAPDGDAVWTANDSATELTGAGGATLPGPITAATGCADFPEISVNATGTPARGAAPFSDTRGILDQHAHIVAFDFLGGDLHCGRPWSPLGVTVALPDCSSIQTVNAPVQNFLDFGDPTHAHDPVGWPTFHDWPNHNVLTYENDYYRWLQRAWMGGLRIIETNMVDNEELCQVMPQHHTDCIDDSAVDRQIAYLRQLQDYIDAQAGGPGKGWFRIVENPYQARKVINQGKLAVVMGVEVSRILGCGVYNDVPEAQCTTGNIDTGLDRLRAKGIRSFFPVHKFDNAFGGTKMDGGALGVLINAANRDKTGAFWNIKTCTTDETDHDQIATGPGTVSDLFGGQALGGLGAGILPVYPAGPHCNQRGLTALGDHVLRGMAKRHLLVEIDHMDGRTAQQALSLLEGIHYSGVLSSHTWDVPANDNPRIRALGGSVSPYGGSSTGFVAQWAFDRKTAKTSKYRYGIGYGADMNGLGSQGGPREGADKNPVTYPFKSFDGSVTFDRQQSGSRTFDINKDGVAMYGMIPDWLRDIRIIGGPQVEKDLLLGPEMYLETWERAYGVKGPSCVPGALTAKGIGKVRIGMPWKRVLRRAGQPLSRPGLSFRWCGAGTPNYAKRSKNTVRAGFVRGRVAIVGRRGARVPAAALRGTHKLGALRYRRAGTRLYVYRGRTVQAVTKASALAGGAPALKALLKTAGL
ncbi:MAG: hypothetical protein QOF76_1801 [Solirubrobacteraceae bacterium]|nr:hypothetical protein [Solirubrobacteraceae bacterium]